MSEKDKQELSKLFLDIPNLRGSMDTDDFRDYMLGFLFLKYLSDNYENQVKNSFNRSESYVRAY